MRALRVYRPTLEECVEYGWTSRTVLADGRRVLPPIGGGAGDYSRLILSHPSLVSYWRLDEGAGPSAADSKGANTGTYVGTPTFSQAGALAGDADAAVLLDGTTAYISTTYNPFIAGSTRTFECWAKSSSSPSGRVMFGSSANPWATLFFDSATQLGYYPKNSAEAIWAGAWPGNGVWVHVVLTWNDSTKTGELFINGSSLGAHTIADAYATPGNFTIGFAQGTAGFFPGNMDEVAVYSAIVSADVVSQHYAYGKGAFGVRQIIGARNTYH